MLGLWVWDAMRSSTFCYLSWGDVIVLAGTTKSMVR
jgi:hypothetical protein